MVTTTLKNKIRILQTLILVHSKLSVLWFYLLEQASGVTLLAFFFLSNLLFLSTSVSTVLVFSYPALFQCISMMQCYFSSFGPPLVIIYTSLMHFYLTLIFELFFLMYFVFNVKLIIYSTSYHTMGITINLYYFL